MSPRITRSLAVACLAAASIALPLSAQTCTPAWLPAAAPPGLGSTATNSNEVVYACEGFTDPETGQPVLLAGMASAAARRFDGREWRTVPGQGSFNTRFAGVLTLPGDTTPSLYISASPGVVQGNFARWNGTGLERARCGRINNDVYAAIVFDDGSGPALFVGGQSVNAGPGLLAACLRWDGTTWTTATAGIGSASRVTAFCIHDPDGAGPLPASLYAAGNFFINGQSHGVARWTASGWESAGNISNGNVNALVSFDPDDNGPLPPRLYAGGDFGQMGGTQSFGFASYNGESWSPVFTTPMTGTQPAIYSFRVFRESPASTPRLFIGGNFATLGGQPVAAIARFDGAALSAVGGGIDRGVYSVAAAVYSLGVYDDGTGRGPGLIACGNFANAGGLYANRIAMWRGGTWHSLGGGPPIQAIELASMPVESASAVPDLVALGYTYRPQGAPTPPVYSSVAAIRERSGWRSLVGSPGYATAYAIARSVDSDSDSIYLGGGFTGLNGVPAASVARIRHTGPNQNVVVETLGSGLQGDILNGATAFAIAVQPRPNQHPLIYVGGHFQIAGGVPAMNIAVWDGASWSPLGSGLGGTAAFDGVNTLLFFDDDGPGPNQPMLYAGGSFAVSGAAPVRNIARWNGAQWEQPGSGLPSGPVTGLSYNVQALIAYDDDGLAATPDRLYLGGGFTLDGASATGSALARWTGSAFESVLASGGPLSSVNALALFDDAAPGTPPRQLLYMAGMLVIPGEASATHLARFDGQSVTRVGTGLSGTQPLVFSLATHKPVDAHNAVFIAGTITSVGGVQTYNIAAWAGCPRCPADFDLDNVVTPADVAAFINSWLASLSGGTLAADFDSDGAITPADINAFVTAWLGALQNGC